MDALHTTEPLTEDEFNAACSELAESLVAILNGVRSDVAMTVLEESLAYLIALDGGEDGALEMLVAAYRNLCLGVREELQLLRSRTLQ